VEFPIDRRGRVAAPKLIDHTVDQAAMQVSILAHRRRRGI